MVVLIDCWLRVQLCGVEKVESWTCDGLVNVYTSTSDTDLSLADSLKPLVLAHLE